MTTPGDPDVLYAAHIAHQHSCAACNSSRYMCPTARTLLNAWVEADHYWATVNADIDDARADCADETYTGDAA